MFDRRSAGVGILLGASLFACAEPPPVAPLPPPTPPPPVVSAAPVAPARPVLCAKASRPYPTWETSERAQHDAAAPFTSAVSIGNQLPLADSAHAWAVYLSAVHNRIHAIFTDTYLASLCTRDLSDPLNDTSLHTRIELSVAPDGTIDRIGVVARSGQPSFDAAAIDTFERATDLPRPDPSLLSGDGRAHFQWELSRNEIYGCSTMQVHPFHLK